tara:strand:- start:435 stop:791 length:357 start_codon:yes stop_codon:yes gene_type:complete
MERLKNTSGFGIKERHSAVAQLVERLPVKEMVVGSSPTRGANQFLDDPNCLRYNIFMNTKSRTITGIPAVLLGLSLVVLAIFKDLWILIYGIPILIIGVFIFFNKKEDNIEEIKDHKK